MSETYLTAFRALLLESAFRPCDQTLECKVCRAVWWDDTHEHEPGCPVGEVLGMRFDAPCDDVTAYRLKDGR